MNASLIAIADEIEYRNIRLVSILTKTSTQLLQEAFVEMVEKEGR